MSRTKGAYGKSMYDEHKAFILQLRSFGMGITTIIRRLGFGSRQSLYNYLHKLKKLQKDKTALWELSYKQLWSLSKKIAYAKQRVKAFYESQKAKVYIAYSGGKDSSVLLHLVRQLYPDTKALFCNTTNEYPEILDFVRQTPNVTWLHPKMSFNETVKTYGFPLVSKKVSRAVHDLKNPTPFNANSRRMYLEGIGAKGQNLRSYKLSLKWHFLIQEPFDITNRCCDILKKEPFKRYEKESGERPYIGTSALESKMRKENYLKYGCNIYEGDAKSRPLSIFSQKDIWAYIRRYGLSYARIYDDTVINKRIVKGEKRTGCAYCAFGAQLEPKGDNRFTRLRLRKPRQFEKMMKLENNGVSYKEALEKVGVL